MKIVFSSFDDVNNPIYHGGGARRLSELSRELVHRGHKITVVTGNYKGACNEVINGVFYKRIGFSFTPGKLGQLFYHFILPYYVYKLEFDLWVETFTPPWSTSFLPLFTKKPVIGLVAIFHGKAKSIEYKLPFHFVEKLGLKCYKYVIVKTPSNKQLIKAINNKSDIIVISNPMDISLFQDYSELDAAINKRERSQTSSILYIGRIDFYTKGLDLLFKSLMLINGSSTILNFAGDGSKQSIELLDKEIQQLDNFKSINRLGWVSGKDRVKLYNETSLVVLPSRIEGFCTVILDAVQTMTPILIYDIDELNWAPNIGVEKVEPFDYVQYAKKINEILEGKINLTMSKEEHATIVNQYNSKVIYDRYEKYFQKVFMKNTVNLPDE